MAKKTIYTHFDQATQYLSAVLILDKKMKPVGRVVFKYPKDGAGRVWCYLHFYSLEMQRDFARGYGYDKRNTAICAASFKSLTYFRDANLTDHERATFNAHKKLLQSIANKCNGGAKEWDRVARDLGYTTITIM